ncbi:MAG: tetratricopeptide repeat protein [bacterium]|nr:tetratricopeptide repeat protein [bacterium]
MLNEDNVSDKYGVKVGPSLLVIDHEGEKVDILKGFYSNVDELKETLRGTASGETTFSGLKKRNANDPDDIEVAFKLAQKYDDVWDSEKSFELFEKILERPEEAKKYSARYEYYDTDLNLYEYTRNLHTWASYRKDRKYDSFYGFVEEFPESVLTERMYEIICSDLSRSSDKAPEEANALFKDIMGKYPHNETLPYYFMMFTEKNKEYLDEGIKVGKDLLKKNRYLPNYKKGVYAKLLAEKGDTKELNEVYGVKFIKDELRSLTLDMRTYINFWKDREDAPDNLLEVAKKAYEIDKDYTKQIYAELLLRNGDEETMSEVYGLGYVREIWDDPGRLSTYAGYYQEKGIYLESALTAAKRAVEIKPDDARALDTLGMVYWKLKQYDKALEAAEKALEIYPENKNFRKRIDDIKADMEKEKTKK